MFIEFNGRSPRVHPTAFVAPNATLVGDVVVEENASIWYGAVLRADQNLIRVGAESNVQDGAVLHCDSPDLPGYPVIIGDRVTIGHGTVLHGCTIEDEALIGNGAVVLDNAIVGAGSIVGAGAVVAPGMRIPAKSLAVGIPARVRREAAPGDLPDIAPYSIYLDLARRHRQAIGEAR